MFNTANLENALLMRIHCCEGSNLTQIHVLPIAKGDDLVEGEDQIEGLLNDAVFVGRCTVLGNLRNQKKSCNPSFTPLSTTPCITHHTGKQSQRLQIFEDVAGFGGDQNHVELLKRLVHITHRLRVNVSVLKRWPASDQLRKRQQQALDSGASHLDELTRDEGFALFIADASGE